MADSDSKMQADGGYGGGPETTIPVDITAEMAAYAGAQGAVPAVTGPPATHGAPSLHNAYHNRLILKLPEAPESETVSVEYRAANAFNGLAALVGGGSRWLPAPGEIQPAAYYFSTSSPYAKVFVITELQPATAYSFRVVASNAFGSTPGLETAAPISTISSPDAIPKIASLQEGKLAAERRLQPRIDDLNAQVERQTKELSESAELIATLRGKVQGYESELAQAIERERKAQDEAERTVRSNASELRTLNIRLEAAERAKTAAEEQLKKTGDGPDAASRIALLQSQLNDLQTQLETAKAQVEDSVAATKYAEEQYALVREQLTSANNDKQTLNAELTEAQTSLAAISAGFEALQAESANTVAKDDYDAVVADRDALRSSLEATSQELTGLKESLASREAGVPQDVFNSQKARLEAAEAELKEALNAANTKLAESESARLADVNTLTAQLAASEARAASLKTEVESYERKVAALEAEGASSGARTTPAPLLRATSSLAAENSELATLRDENIKLRYDLDEQIRLSSEDRSQLTGAREAARLAENRFYEILDSSRQRDAAMTQAMVGLTTLRAEYNSIKAERDRLLAASHGGAAIALPEWEQEKKRLSERVDHQAERIQVLEGEVKAAKEAAERLNKERTDLAARAVDLAAQVRAAQDALTAARAGFDTERQRLIAERTAESEEKRKLMMERDQLRAAAGGADSVATSRVAELERALAIRSQDLDLARLQAGRFSEELARVKTELGEIRERYTTTAKNVADAERKINRLRESRDTLFDDMGEMMKPVFHSFASTARNVDHAVSNYLTLRHAGFNHAQSKEAVLRYPNNPDMQATFCLGA